MASLAEQFRERAKALRELSTKLVDEPDVLTNPTKLVSAIVGHVQANNLEALADTIGYLRASVGSATLLAQRQAFLDKSNKIREAAARGDWEEFDRLVAAG